MITSDALKRYEAYKNDSQANPYWLKQVGVSIDDDDETHAQYWLKQLDWEHYT